MNPQLVFRRDYRTPELDAMCGTLVTLVQRCRNGKYEYTAGCFQCAVAITGYFDAKDDDKILWECLNCVHVAPLRQSGILPPAVEMEMI